MTEEEAKTKWCPMTAPIAANDLKKRTCEGSGCMWWEWTNQQFHRPVELWSKSKGRRVNSAYTDDSEWRPIAGQSPDDPPAATGRCSMGGEP